MNKMKAPDGNRIVGIVQSRGEVVGINWSATRLKGETLPAGYAQGSDLNYVGYAVFEDDDGGRWLYHHLIDDDVDVSRESVDDMVSEINWRQRAQLLYELADTFIGQDDNRRYWGDMADEWKARANEIAWSHGWLVRPSLGLTTDYPPCESFAKPAARGGTIKFPGGSIPPLEPWSISEHRKTLMALAGESVRLDQVIADTPLLGLARPALEGVASLLGKVIVALQAQAIAAETRHGFGIDDGVAG